MAWRARRRLGKVAESGKPHYNPLLWFNAHNSRLLTIPLAGRAPLRSFARKRAQRGEGENPLTKTELQERIRQGYEKLTKALEGLTEEEATRVGLNPQWSIKDALAHITAWEFEGARIVSEIQSGTWEQQEFNQQVIDEFNARAVAARRANSMAEVRNEWDTAHLELERVVETLLPDEVDESAFASQFVKLVTYKHHTHHAAQIEKFRES